MESLFDSDMIAELESLLKGIHHEDSQDTAALALPPTAGILGAAAVLLNPKLKEKAHVDAHLGDAPNHHGQDPARQRRQPSHFPGRD